MLRRFMRRWASSTHHARARAWRDLGMAPTCRVVRCGLGCFCAAIATIACRESPQPRASSQPAPVATSAPAPTTASAPTSEPIDAPTEAQTGWLYIEELDANAPGGWASGHRPAPNRIEIETENVRQFSMDISQIELNWNERVWVQINHYAFQLGYKRHPVVHLRETRTGAWDVVEVHDP